MNGSTARHRRWRFGLLYVGIIMAGCVSNLSLWAASDAVARGSSHGHGPGSGQETEQGYKQAQRESHTVAPEIHALHMKMSPVRAPKPGDVRKARDIAAATRLAIEKYKDVAVARADGFRPFGDTAQARHVHFVHLGHSIRERWSIAPHRPGSLLYKKGADGRYTLVGAMFGAPADATLSELDARVPLSQARWHMHTNICVPRPIWNREKWAERSADGTPVYGPFSRVATQAGCDAVGGRFKEHVFGWMAHVYPFRADPARYWDDAH